MYELKAIMIHSGSPYGGHYWLYGKDDLNEGKWDLNLPENFAAEPSEVDEKSDKKKDEEKVMGDNQEVPKDTPKPQTDDEPTTGAAQDEASEPVKEEEKEEVESNFKGSKKQRKQ